MRFDDTPIRWKWSPDRNDEVDGALDCDASTVGNSNSINSRYIDHHSCIGQLRAVPFLLKTLSHSFLDSGERMKFSASSIIYRAL